jgi:F-type H+-transporting ATPase subunit epsilon
VATIQLQIVTPERVVLEEDADIVVARAADGDIGILHGHEPLLSPLEAGELTYRTRGEEHVVAVAGGFLEVTPDHVVVLADTAERSDEIDRERAEAARVRAEQALEQRRGTEMEAETRAALQRALLRLRIAENRGRRRHERAAPRTEA